MKSTMEKVSTNKVKLRMELEAEKFEEAMQKAYLKARGRINVPGFRKGKAPRRLIEQMYGENLFYEDAFDAVFPDMYDEAIKENDLRVVGQPDVNIDTIQGGQALVVLAEVYVHPEVTLGEYKGLDIARPDDTVGEDAVDQEIGRVRKRNARETEIEGRPVQDDDIVGLDYAGSIDGKVFDGGTAQGQTLTIGSGSFIPGFEEQMIGMNIGEEKDIIVTFPAEYHAEELAGKEAVFHVKVNSIRTSDLPDLDDEFAKDVSEFDTFAQYKADVRNKLEKEAANRATAQYENELVEAAAENAAMELPPPMIESQIDSTVRDMAMRMAYQGMRMEDYLQYTGQTLETLREQYRDAAEKQVRGNLVIAAIRKAEGIEPTQAEIDEVTARYAAQSGQETEKFAEDLTEQQTEHIKEDAATIAVLEFLKKEALPAGKAKTAAKESAVKTDDASKESAAEKETKKSPAKASEDAAKAEGAQDE